MLSIMSQCLRILAPKLWIMSEAWCRKPKLQNFDVIIRNSVLTSNANLVWRALLLAFIILPVGLSLAYKVFVGGYSTHNLGHHTSAYGMTGVPGLTRSTVLKFGPSYMTNATLPFIMTSADYLNLPPFPQTYGFNNLVISNTLSAFLDAPLANEFLALQQSLQDDITSIYTLTANVHATVTRYNHSIETSRADDACWDSYLNQLGLNSTLDSFQNGISWIDLSSGKTLGMINANANGNKADSSWTILSFYLTSDRFKLPEYGSWNSEPTHSCSILAAKSATPHGKSRITLCNSLKATAPHRPHYQVKIVSSISILFLEEATARRLQS